MKRFTKCICLILALSLCLAVPAAAAEAAPYGSRYFGSQAAYMWRTSSTSFQIWFEVTTVREMDEIGIRYIDVERSSDGVNWTVVKTYDKANYSNFIAYDTSNHCSYVTYTEMQSGYQYRAFVRFHAKNSSGSASSDSYAYFVN